ncbi:MAG TPA: DUF1684 domain-containing protein [Rhodothermales bacterium]
MAHTSSARVFVLLALVLSLAACDTDRAHRKKVEAWHARRVANLTAPDAWLSLTGLFWLKQGENRFGFGSANDVTFPDSAGPAYLGSYILDADSVRAVLAPSSGVLVDGSAHGDTFGVVTDLYEAPTMFEYGSISWYVIDREGKLGIRLMDSLNVARRTFAGIERYPVNREWRIKGRFIPYDPPRSMVVPTVLDEPATLESPGAVEFEIGGEKHRLDVVGEPDAKRLWIIFADPTNRSDTYPAGRYLYIDAPTASGAVEIDFNMSYSPPCAFSDYATCPFPPPQNRMRVPVEAGEKRWKRGGHV